jgi:molybdopterin-guanine dinucleotide biosynthesis protein A
MAFTGVVLTGGAGRRMPSSYPAKPLIMLEGAPLVSYPQRALVAAGASAVLAVGGDQTSLEALGLIVVADTYPGRGPLGGITRALEIATDDLAVVLACDTPFVTEATIVRLFEAADGHAGATATVDGRREPLIAAYRRSVRPVFEAALAADGAVQRALADLHLAAVEIDASEASNVNTPADLEEAARRLKRLRRRSTWPEGGGR